MSNLWSKYENWSKLEMQNRVYRYIPNVYRYTLAKNDQKPKCTGTCSKCTGTLHRKVPKMCVFSHFSCTFIHGSLLYFLHTSKTFQYHSNMGYDPYTNQAPRFVRICSKPSLNFFPFHHESNNKWRIPYLFCSLWVLPTLISRNLRL